MDASDEGAAVARWATAEHTLYSSMVSDPPSYERVVGLVGALVDHLRDTVHDGPELVAASARGVALVADVSPESVVPWIPAQMALDAACAVRRRELQSAAERQERTSTLDCARRAGQTWARLQSDAPGMFGATAPVTIVHVPSGAAIVCATEMDPSTGGALFAVSAVRVDPGTGAVVGEVASLGPTFQATTLVDRDERVNMLSDLIERLDSENHLV